MDNHEACLLLQGAERQLDDFVQGPVGLRPVSQAAHQRPRVLGPLLRIHRTAVLLHLQTHCNLVELRARQADKMSPKPP